MALFKGTAADQAKEVAAVFTKALAANDTETAYGLICDAERGRITPDQLAGDYLRPGHARRSRRRAVSGSTTRRSRYVQVRWDDEREPHDTELTVVPEGGTQGLRHDRSWADRHAVPRRRTRVSPDVVPMTRGSAAGAA